MHVPFRPGPNPLSRLNALVHGQAQQAAAIAELRAGPRGGGGFWALLGAAGATAGTYGFAEAVESVVGEWVEVDGGRGSDGELAVEVNAVAGLAAGVLVWIEHGWAEGGEHVYRFRGPGLAGVPFACLLTKDGAGTAGSASTECTYTYTVKTLDDATTLATGLTPQVPRLHYTAYWYAGETRTAPATATSRYGLAVRNGVTLVLLVAYGEIAKDDVC